MNTQSRTAPFDLDAFLAWCTDAIARGADYAAYDAAFVRRVDVLFPPPAEGSLRDDPDLRRRLARCMARAIWRQTPHPAHRYAAAPLPSAERNAPCHCGSGAKYKQCCQLIERDVPLDRMNLLPRLLDALPSKRWGELPGSRIALDMVEHTAQEWSEEGRDQDVLALLEPWFGDDMRFDARHELLFDQLLDAYTNLGKPRKKSTLLDRALAHGDRTLRSAAMQRRVSMLADAGDYSRAWTLFAEAQRSDPESPSLSHLEVTLLLSEGREPEARERARFWLLRLQRRRDPDLAELIGFLRRIADEGARAMLQVAADSDADVATFLELWRAVPPIAVHYALKPQGDSAGPLQSSPVLSKALKNWNAAFPRIAYSPLQDDGGDDIWMVADAWLPVLRQQPILWNAFEVLDALARAAAQIPVPGTEDLTAAILERGERLLREVIRANGVDDLKLEWGWLENRPALSLLGGRIAREQADAPSADNLARLEWLVRTLNPSDNQGFRSDLLRRYLELDRPADALAFTDLYPDDFAAMRCGRALALFALDQVGLATFALRDAVQAYPKLLAWLLKPNPKEPRSDPFGVTVGGDYEAWIYRSECLGQWQRLGALDWARRIAPARKR
jgi:hypothetical protein